MLPAPLVVWRSVQLAVVVDDLRFDVDPFYLVVDDLQFDDDLIVYNEITCVKPAQKGTLTKFGQVCAAPLGPHLEPRRIMSDAVDKTTDMAAAYAQQGRDAAGAATNMLSARLSGVAAAVRATPHPTSICPPPSTS